MIQVNAMGDACPIPVVKTIKAMNELQGAGEIEVLVDNEIAVQNLTKMAKEKQCAVKSCKLEEGKYQVIITVEGEGNAETEETPVVCTPDAGKNTVVVIASEKMGEGDETLGRLLMKGFLYALTQQEELPSTILFYNGGAKLTCEDAPTLEDLRALEAQGVEILTCGTCLNHYGLSEKLQVGSVTNMYVIVEKMTKASRLVKP